MVCEGCGRRTTPDLSGLCHACLSDEWRAMRQRATLRDLDGLRAAAVERPLPEPQQRRIKATAARIRAAQTLR